MEQPDKSKLDNVVGYAQKRVLKSISDVGMTGSVEHLRSYTDMIDWINHEFGTDYLSAELLRRGVKRNLADIQLPLMR